MTERKAGEELRSNRKTRKRGAGAEGCGQCMRTCAWSQFYEGGVQPRAVCAPRLSHPAAPNS
eukprot:2283488-Prymnesium_polylepis.2